MARHRALDDVLRFRTVADPQLSPDGLLVAFTRSHPDQERDREIAHAWVVPAAGGEAVRWTRGERGEGAPRWSPDGRRLACRSPRADCDARQAWVLDAADGKAR